MSTTWGDPIVDRTALVDRNIFRGTADKEWSVFDDQNGAVNYLPGSLFYDGQTELGGRSGLFNYYVIGDNKYAPGGQKIRYDFTETFAQNQMITPDVSRNPTAFHIINETTTSGNYLNPSSRYVSQPYNVKDFIFCKHYGVIPNNRMITLRRFPTPVMDNLRVPTPGKRLEPITKADGSIGAQDVQGTGISKQEMMDYGAALPIAQAVTFFGEGTGNNLTDILSISTGLKWDTRSQSNKLQTESNDPGIMGSQLGEFMKGLGSEGFNKNADGISNLIGTFTDPQNIDLRVRRTYWDKLTTGDGPLSKRIFVDVNTVTDMLVRGQGFTGGQQTFSLVFTYSLTSVGKMNSKMLFVDLLANLLAIGSDYGKFLTPQLLVNSQRQGIGFPGGSAGYVKSLVHPVEYLNEQLANSFTAEMTQKKKQLVDNVEASKKELQGLKDGKPLAKDGVLYKTLSALLTSKLIEKIKYEPVMLSGYPTGEWHVMVGNPLNPISMMGNMVCDGISIKLNNVLGPDDFPTEMTATFSMKSARQKHRGDYESMFNRGRGRLYLGKMSISELSKNAEITGQSGKDVNSIDANDTKELFESLANNMDYE
jgi:hypothetical protein